jgi:hypothetical protein
MEDKYTKKFQNASTDRARVKPSAKSTHPYPYYFKNNSSIITMVTLKHMFMCYFFHCTSSVSLQKCKLIFSKEHEMPWRVRYLITSGASICHCSPSSPANLQITDAGGRHTINPLCLVCVYNVLFSVALTTVKCLHLLAKA